MTENYSFEIADTATRKFQLDVNDLYDYPAMTAIQPLQTCPLTSEIKQVEAPWSSGNQFVFDTNFGKTQFVSNCFKFHFTVPLTVTLAADSTAGAITSSNFMTTLFAGQDDICYSQYSFMQALQTMSIDINSRNIMNQQNVAETLNQIAPYYARSDVDEWFHASQPDRFQSFETYTGTTAQELLFVNQHGNSTRTSVNAINEANIFASRYQKGYVSRTPQWTWVSEGTDALRSANLKASFWVYLPLTFGSVPSQMTALSGINRMAVTFGLKADLASHLFNIKKTTGAHRYSSIALNTSGIGDTTSAQMLVQVYSAPQYMRDKMVSPATGLMQPYSISFPRIITTTGNTYPVAAYNTQNFNMSNIQSGVVPKSIYIALQKVKKGSFVTASSTPINYGLITNLSLRIESAHTNFPSILSLDHLTNTNGYDELDPLGKLIKGFPIKLDVGKDISLPGDMVVGQTYPFTFEVLGNVQNQSDAPAEYKLLVTVVSDATLDFDGVDFQQSSGVLVDNSMLSDKHFLKTQYSLYQRKVNVLGGGMFGDAVRWVGRNAISLAKNAWENRDKIAKTVGDVVGLVKAVRGGSRLASNVSGGAGTRTMGAGKVRETVFK